MAAEIRRKSALINIDFPTGWTDLSTALDGETRGTLEPDQGQPFAANLILVAEDLAGLDFRSWQESAELVLPGMLTGYLLLDVERCEVGGYRGGRRLAQYASAEGMSITMEQWMTAVFDIGVTVTGSVDTLRYPEFAELFRAVVASLSISGGRDV